VPSRPAAGRSGELVADRYLLKDVVGAGGQSVVYRASDRFGGPDVAAKVCEYGDPDAAERMFREALMMSRLEGTAAVRMLHQCQTDDGALVLVMELLSGRDLAAILRERDARGERPTFAWVASILEPIVRTLEAAHEREMVHRDVKAENVFVLDPAPGEAHGGVRLLDFGFAKITRMPAITAADALAGSPSYMAPEVWKNGVAKATSRADIYALGVLVFRALAGRLPFEGTTVEVARAVMGAPRPSLHALRPDLPADVDAWVAQVLAIDPGSRFAKITAAWRALEACVSGA
jgi:serine/threonine-protein kinase